MGNWRILGVTLCLFSALGVLVLFFFIPEFKDANPNLPRILWIAALLLGIFGVLLLKK